MPKRIYRFILCFFALLEISKANNLLQSEDVKIQLIPFQGFAFWQKDFVYTQKIQLKFTFQNKVIVLLLMQDYDRKIDIPVYTVDSNGIYRVDTFGGRTENDMRPRSYSGDKGSFSILCERDPHSLHRCQISGIFYNQGILWGVLPLQITKQRHNKNRYFSPKRNISSWHRIFKPSNTKHDPVWKRPANWFLKDTRLLQQDSLSRRRRAAKKEYIIEVAFILHAEVYSALLKLLPQTMSNMQMIFFIKEYYSLMTRGIDTMFKTMTFPKYSVGVKLTSLIYSYEKKKSALFQDKDITWDKFNAWFNDSTNNITRMCDHAILLMNKEIQDSKEYSMCTVSSTSVIREHFGFQTAIGAAQALSVSIGIQADEDGNDCKIGDQYIMSSRNFAVKDTVNLLNKFRFSSCSKVYLKNFLNKTERSFCLLTASNYSKSYDKFFLMPSGQRLTASQQCQLRFGNESNVYECEDDNFKNQDTFCAQMFCLKRDRCAQMIPLLGTSCGKYQWCIDGYCRSNWLAPNIPMSCWLGDKSENPIFPNSNFTCKDISYGSNMYLCYDEKIRSVCCWTCYFLRNTLEDCPYGDRSTDCWERECSFYSRSKVANDCCFTCRAESGSNRVNSWHRGLFILALLPLKIHLT